VKPGRESVPLELLEREGQKLPLFYLIKNLLPNLGYTAPMLVSLEKASC
jgi:hypothetical protein